MGVHVRRSEMDLYEREWGFICQKTLRFESFTTSAMIIYDLYLLFDP
jgi:hypothetical protein